MPWEANFHTHQNKLVPILATCKIICNLCYALIRNVKCMKFVGYGLEHAKSLEPQFPLQLSH